jgi:orotate phosphoribosyltransferase
MAAAARLATTDGMPKSDGREELRALIRARSFKTGKFILVSGKESTLYFNMKPTMMHPRGAELAALELLRIATGLDAEYAGGLEMGAVPVIGAMAGLSSAAGRPVKTFFVRKEPKKHGTMDLIEGLAPDESLAGQRVLIVDDVATSGGSFMKAIKAARDAGAVVEHAACIVDRQEGAEDLLRQSGVALHAVFRAADFVAAG